MTIEDKQLREAFHQSSEEHLHKIDEGLLYLEKHPDDKVQIEALLREIHSLKSEAAGLELKEIVTLANQIEHVLGTIASRESVVSPELLDRLSEGAEAIHKLVREAVTGEPSGVQAFYVLARLMGARGGGDQETRGQGDGENSKFKIRLEKLNGTETDTAHFSQNSSWKVEQEGNRHRSLPAKGKIPVSLQPSEETRRQGDESIEVSRLYIEDEELRQTFKIACEEHLEKLDRGLLHLEKQPDDGAKVEELLREIHSIKGDAGMLGVEDIVPLAHEWEQQLIPVGEGKIPFSLELSDRLDLGLDAIRRLTCEAVTGKVSGVKLSQVLQDLTQTSPEKGDPGKPEVSIVESEEKDSIHRHSSQNSPSLESHYRIDTIRVETRHLDTLMTQAGELTVSQIRIAHRLGEMEELVDLWEEWNRDFSAARAAFQGLKRHNGFLQPLQILYQRAETRLERIGDLTNRLKHGAAEESDRLATLSGELEDGIRTLRLLPLSTIFNLYPRMVRDLARRQGKEVDFLISGGETRADKRILEEMKDPLLHLLRNAIDHGIETPYEREQQGKPPTARLGLRGRQTATHIVIEVMDDGRGLDLKKIKQTALKRGLYREEELATMTMEQIQSLLFMPGFSTRSFANEVSGRGVGLDVVHANVERLKGSIQIQSTPRQGCIIRLQLGTSLATAHVLLVAVNGIPYALPIEFVQTARRIGRHEIFPLEGRDTILLQGQPISVMPLADLLELRGRSPLETIAQQGQQLCIILKVGPDFLGLFVDALLDEQDVILKPQSHLLKRVRNVSGATILGTGEVCMVLDPQDLLKSARLSSGLAASASTTKPEVRQKVILLVEDSIATRTQEKRILEGAGYEVVTAVDGLDGLNQLKTREFDAVVSDIQMPNLNGLEMTSRIRSQPEYSELPIILVTSLATNEDRRKGAELGANAYIIKTSFNLNLLVETLSRLV